MAQPEKYKHRTDRRNEVAKDSTTYLLRDIPTELWDKVKHKAIDEGLTIKDYIFKLLEKETRPWQERKTETGK